MDNLDYTNDPRAILIHANPYHDPESGRFTTASGRRSIGQRKYVNPDGSLTKRGEARYEEEKRRNRLKKKDNQVKDETDLLDPALWDRQDTERRKDVIDATKRAVDTLRDVDREVSRDVKNVNVDLSSMSDAELRARVNRLQTEASYKNLLSQTNQTTKRGLDYLDTVLKYAGSALAVTSSSLAIALAIKQLRG